VRAKPKSLVLDLLSSLKGGSMPVRALIATGGIFGLPENSVRVALARLVASGLVEHDERAHYRLGPRALGVQAHVASWRTIEDRIIDWEGEWLAVYTGALKRSSRKLVEHRARCLRLGGLRSLCAGLEIRPDNIDGGVERLRAQLGDLGFDTDAPVFTATTFDASMDARARGLWDTRAMREGYRRTIGKLERSERRLAELPEAVAMRESFTLGGAAIRQVVLDPLLPDAIVPAHERQALIETLKRYDDLGKAVWSQFLRRNNVLHRHTPADTAVLYAAGRAAVLPQGATP